MTTEELKNSDLWWHGPNFLRQPEHEWPKIKPEFKQEKCEEKIVKTILTAAPKLENFIGKINHRNSIRTWQRIVAYCIKFITPSKPDELPNIGSLTTDHLKRAMTELLNSVKQQN